MGGYEAAFKFLILTYLPFYTTWTNASNLLIFKKKDIQHTNAYFKDSLWCFKRVVDCGANITEVGLNLEVREGPQVSHLWECSI